MTRASASSIPAMSKRRCTWGRITGQTGVYRYTPQASPTPFPAGPTPSIAKRHRLNIVAVVGNDSTWGIDRRIQLGLCDRPVATDLLPSVYVHVVQGLGGHGELVEKPKELSPALERAFNSGKPALLKRGGPAGHKPLGRSSHRQKEGHQRIIGSCYLLLREGQFGGRSFGLSGTRYTANVPAWH